MNRKQEETAEGETKNRPVHQVRFGNVRAAIWSNQTERGQMFNVSVTRSYKTKGDDGNDVWADSTSFGRDDLLSLAKALDHAHTWICSQQQS